MFECACENARKKSATVEKLETIPAYSGQTLHVLTNSKETHLDDRTSQPKLVYNDIHDRILRQPRCVRREFRWTCLRNKCGEGREEEFCRCVAWRGVLAQIRTNQQRIVPPVEPCLMKSPWNCNAVCERGLEGKKRTYNRSISINQNRNKLRLNLAHTPPSLQLPLELRNPLFRSL